MPRPLPVNLLMAGTGAVLLVSGISGEPIGKVLQGQFGDLKGTGQAKQAALAESGVAQNVADVTAEGGTLEGQSTPSLSTFAPSPLTLDSRHSHGSHDTQQQAREIAEILLRKGITNPNAQQITEARRQYERETGIIELLPLPVQPSNPTGRVLP